MSLGTRPAEWLQRGNNWPPGEPTIELFTYQGDDEVSDLKPTPLRHDKDGNVFYADGFTLGMQSNVGNSHERRMKFAEFTVRACNAHDALVEAVKELLGYPKACGHPWTCVCVPDKARAALKLAEPAQDAEKVKK